MLYQLISLTGAGMVLAAYLAYQRGWAGRHDRLYNLLNFVGASLLAWVAIVDERWGFIVLEVVWALLSIPPLLWPPSRGGDSAATGAPRLPG